MGYLVITISFCLMPVVLIVAPAYFFPLFFWNLGFWPRFVAASRTKTNLSTRANAYMLLGILNHPLPPELTGAMFQITAYFALVEATVLNYLVQDRVLRGGIYFLLMWFSMWGALEIVKLMARRFKA